MTQAIDEGYDAVRLLLRVGILEWCNLELLRVGVYRVEVSASLLFPGRASPLHGAPLHFSSAPLRLHALSRGRYCELDASVPLAVGEVDEDAPCFRTRALHVRYGDEAHALNEAATFAFEGAPPPAACPPNASLLVRFRLLRAPPPEKEDGGGGGGGGAFELCAVRTLRLPGERALRGVRAWAPVCWGAAHLALAGVTLHSAVVAARFMGAPPAPRRPPELAHAEARAARAAREEEDARRGVPGAAAARFMPTGSAGGGGGGGGARGGGALAARGFSGGAAPPPRGGDGASRLPPWAAAYTAALRARAAAPLSLCEALAAPAAGGDGDCGDGAAPNRARPAEAFAAALVDALGVVVGEGEGEPGGARRAAAAFERVRGAEAALAAAEAAAAAWAAPGGCGSARSVDAHAWAARWCTLLSPLAAAAAATEAWRAEAREAAEAALAECSRGHERGGAAGETYSTSRFFGVGGAGAAAPPAAAAAPPPSPPPPPPPPLAGAAAAALEAALSAAGAAAERTWRALCAALLSTGDLSVAPLQRSFRDSAAAWARAACAPAGTASSPLAALPRAPPAALSGPLPEGPFPPPPRLPRERCLDAAAECAPFALRAVAMEYGERGGGAGGGGGAEAASRQRSPPPPGTHAVVFVSGLGGSKADLRCLRAALKVHHPRLFCVGAGDSVCGTAGEGDLLAVGLALAAEVAAAVSPAALAAEGVPPLRALSFVCFSMGGVWARVALRARALAHVRPLLHAFVTFASPHLGFPPSAAGHALVSAGAFFSRLAGRLPVLQQLAHGDRGADGAPSLLELLAEGWGEGAGGGAPAAALAAAGLAPVPNGALLAPARHVVLAGSPQDSYSPLASALAAAPAPGAAGERAAAAFWRGLEGPAAGGAARRVWRVSVHFSEWHASGAPAAARAEAEGLLPPPRDAGSAPPPPPPASLSAAASQGVASVFNSVSGRGAHLGFCGSEELGALLALAPPFAQCWEDD
jgi:hypothetical protein